MKWFFEPHPADEESGKHHGGDAGGVLSLPPALLERHGARVLDPGKAALLPDDKPPRPTVYRTSTLLISGSVLQNTQVTTTIKAVLREIGIELITPAPDRRTNGKDEFDLPQLPQVAVLVPLRGYPRPVVIDAWDALQQLRVPGIAQQLLDKEFLDKEQQDREQLRQKRLEEYEKAVELISLEHLLVTSAITGSPATNGGGGITGGPGSDGSASGPTITSSYLFSGGDPRTPVAILFDPPPRKSSAECTSAYGRRPVVVVMDTGLRAHPWLGVKADGAGGYIMGSDSFVGIDSGIQDAIRAKGELARADGDKRRRVIWNAGDTPVTADPLTGEDEPASGHGIFIAGIVRQIAPDARVLAVRVMHSDDVAYEGDIICALRHLIERIAAAKKNDRAAEADVVSLSFGYFSESPHDKVMTTGLWTAIKELLDLGVVVVAAAGNFATRREFYPAAFARQPVAGNQVPVISAGALNANGTKAMFSNAGDWVTAWARGAVVASTYPVDIDASRTPDLRIPVDRKPLGSGPPGRESLDPDDFNGGWAIWSGTSFSAPYLAALFAAALLKGAAVPGSGLRLNLPANPAANLAAVPVDRKKRAAAARAELKTEQKKLWKRELSERTDAGG